MGKDIYFAIESNPHNNCNVDGKLGTIELWRDITLARYSCKKPKIRTAIESCKTKKELILYLETIYNMWLIKFDPNTMYYKAREKGHDYSFNFYFNDGTLVKDNDEYIYEEHMKYEY